MDSMNVCLDFQKDHISYSLRSLKTSLTKSVLKDRQKQEQPSGQHLLQLPHAHAGLSLNVLTPRGLESSLTNLKQLADHDSGKQKMCMLACVYIGYCVFMLAIVCVCLLDSFCHSQSIA